jgi:hypothetical protein
MVVYINIFNHISMYKSSLILILFLQSQGNRNLKHISAIILSHWKSYNLIQGCWLENTMQIWNYIICNFNIQIYYQLLYAQVHKLHLKKTWICPQDTTIYANVLTQLPLDFNNSF